MSSHQVPSRSTNNQLRTSQTLKKSNIANVSENTLKNSEGNSMIQNSAKLSHQDTVKEANIQPAFHLENKPVTINEEDNDGHYTDGMTP